ncbi:hypothetical protein [Flagellimonas onchidii]|uniref:hypothetical protein n=1 Tax=Flagellimonas onchidii TaxID=2562684 RepID=UPI0010A62350|nr:hypothetical protein [Allomuricauda onchidii]
MKKHSFLKFTLSFFVLLVFFYSCEKEEAAELEITQETEVVQPTEQEIISSKFSLDGFDESSGIAKNSLKILWNEHKKVTLEEREWHEYKVVESVKIDLEKGEITDIAYSLLATMIDDNPAYWLLRMDSRNGEAYSSYFDLEKGGFTGMIYLYNLKGEMSMVRYYQKGNGFHGITKVGNPVALPAPSASRCDFKVTSSNCAGTSDCGLLQSTGGSGCGNGGGKGGYRRVRIPGDIIDRYNDHNNDGKGQPNEYSHTIFMPDRYKWVWVSNTSSGHVPQRGQQYQGIRSDGSIRNIPRPSVSPDRVIKHPSLIKYPCVGRIVGELARGDFKRLRLNKLGQLEGGKHLSKTILDLFQNNSKYHLSIKVGTLSNANGSTKIVRNTPSKGQITFEITLDKRFVQNGTKLVIARTLIHESLHAYLSYQYQNMSTSSFSSLLRHYLSQNGYNNNAAQHRLMTEYGDAIGHSLSVWDNNKLSMQYYKDLGWSGDMLQTREFNKLSTSRKTAIRNANIAEGSAAQSATNKAKGKKCK